MLSCLLHPVWKRKERIRADYRSRQRQDSLSRADSDRIHTAHLPSADAHRLPGARVNNRVGLDMLGDLPRELERRPFVSLGPRLVLTCVSCRVSRCTSAVCARKPPPIDFTASPSSPPDTFIR